MNPSTLDLEVKIINRSAVTTRAKQPFLDWLHSLPDPVDPDMTLAELNEEPLVYLLPECNRMEEREELTDAPLLNEIID